MKFHDQDLNLVYNLTEKADAFSMLVTNRDFNVYQTAPQSIAAATIISAIALKAKKYRKKLGHVMTKRSSFDEMLEAMDEIARTVGPLADYQTFDLTVEMAAGGIRQFLEHDSELFDIDGKCKKFVLQSKAEKLSVVRGEGPVRTLEFISDAKPIDIARAVRRAGTFDFCVGTVPANDEKFLKKLSKNLEKQRLVRAKLH